MIGSGIAQSIGEVSLAHCGILILDEAPEFKTKVLQALREPLDTQQVHISRVGSKTVYPANCLCIFTCNLCPCGNRGKPTNMSATQSNEVTAWHGNTICMCSEHDVFRYWKRIGGALWDRIDIKYQTNYKDASVIHKEEPLLERIQDIAQRREAISRALARQSNRFPTPNSNTAVAKRNGRCNADDIAGSFEFTKEASAHVMHSTKANISDRARISLCRVSRTIADLEDDDMVCITHVDEALRLTFGEHMHGIH